VIGAVPMQDIASRAAIIAHSNLKLIKDIRSGTAPAESEEGTSWIACPECSKSSELHKCDTFFGAIPEEGNSTANQRME
jgi:hypothetical protein